MVKTRLLALLGAFVVGLAPIVASALPITLPVAKNSSGQYIPATPTVNLNPDGTYAGAASITANVHLVPQSGLIDLSAQSFSLTGFGGLRVSMNDPLSGADISFADVRPASSALTVADSATASATGQGASLITGTPTAGSFQDQPINAQSVAVITVTGTFTGVAGVIEGSGDGGTTYVARGGLLSGSPTPTSAITGPGVWTVDVPSITNLRVRLTAISTGTVNVKMAFSSVPGAAKVTNLVNLGACTPYHLASAASNNSAEVSATARTLCWLAPLSTAAANGYLKVYDTATAPTCSSATGLKHVIPVSAGSSTLVGGISLPISATGETYVNGIGICYVGGQTDTDNSNATTGTSIELGWK